MINSRASHWLPRCRDDKSWALLQAAVPVLGLSRRTPHNLEPGHFLSFSIYLITTIWCKQEFYSCNLSFLLQQYVKWLQGGKKKSPLLPQESISVFAGLKKETFCLYSEAMISFVPCIWMLALYLMCLVVFSWKTSIKILTHTHTHTHSIYITPILQSAWDKWHLCGDRFDFQSAFAVISVAPVHSSWKW